MKRIFFIVCLLFSSSLYSSAQQSLRMIDDAKPSDNQPIKVVDRRWRTISLKNNRQVAAGKEWLRDVTFDVQNVGGKPIIGFDMYLTVPRQGRMANPIRIPVVFRSPARDSERVPLRIGESITLGVSESYRNNTATILARFDADDFKKVTLSVEIVYFDDRTAWMGGRMMRQNPNNADEWEPITVSEAKRRPILRLPDILIGPSLSTKAILGTLDMSQRFSFQRGPSSRGTEQEPEPEPTPDTPE